MINLIRAGGVGMWAILLFGFVALGASAAYAWRPRDTKIGFIRSMCNATLCSIFAAMAAALGTVFTHVPAHPEWSKSPDLPLIVMTGIGESMSPPIIGFALLALTYLCIAVGTRRLAQTG